MNISVTVVWIIIQDAVLKNFSILVYSDLTFGLERQKYVSLECLFIISFLQSNS